MKLLKLGGLSSPLLSWTDGLNYFEDLYFVKLKSYEERKKDYNYIELDDTSKFVSFLKRCIFHFDRSKRASFIVEILFCFLRIYYHAELKVISKLDYDEILVSYNDFDDSAFVFFLVYKALHKEIRITRSYKETRPGYGYLEKMSFKLANRIVLNDEENLRFFQSKYGRKLFENKEVILGWDEDYPCTMLADGIVHSEKFSVTDKEKHVVILAGRVFSSPKNMRSGSRLFYIDLIKSFLDYGFIVHLHTKKIYVDENGVNQYIVLQNKNKGRFFIEKPLELQGIEWKKAYSILSRYDYGIIHNFIEGTSNSEFDKYNIAHRYYDYLLAHVIPVIPQGKNIVLEKIIKKNNTGIVYSTLDDIIQCKDNISFEVNTFMDYLNKLYG